MAPSGYETETGARIAPVTIVQEGSEAVAGAAITAVVSEYTSAEA